MPVSFPVIVKDCDGKATTEQGPPVQPQHSAPFRQDGHTGMTDDIIGVQNR